EDVHVGRVLEHARDLARQRLPLVVRGNDDEGSHHSYLSLRRTRTAPMSVSAAIATTPHSRKAPYLTPGVTEVRSGISVSPHACGNSSERSIRRPAGVTTPDTPTVETWSAALPVSMALRRVMASCCVDSADMPNVALLVCTARNSASWEADWRAIQS